MCKKKRSVKEALWYRDNGECFYCGSKLCNKNRTVDHVIPKSKNGSSKTWNLVLSCYECNANKGDAEPSEDLLSLVRQRKALHEQRIVLGKQIAYYKQTNNIAKVRQLIEVQKSITMSITNGRFDSSLLVYCKREVDSERKEISRAA